MYYVKTLLDKYRLPRATEFRHVTRDVTGEQLAVSMDVVKRGDLGRFKTVYETRTGHKYSHSMLNFRHILYILSFSTPKLSGSWR